MTTKRGAIVREILRMLEEEGPMTRSEICSRLSRAKDEVAAIVSRLNKRSPVAGKRIYIKEYVYDMEGERMYPRAVYALGSAKDAPKPIPDQKAVKRRHWAAVMNSIVEDVFKYLEEYGPQTVSEICAEVPKASRWSITAALRILRSEDDPSKRRVYLYDYVREPGHFHRAPRFKVGSLPDRPRPPLPREHRTSTERERLARLRSSSVFNLGLDAATLRKKEEQQ